MSNDDDIIIRGKNKVRAVLAKPLPSVKVWHLVAVAVAAFVLGAWLS